MNKQSTEARQYELAGIREKARLPYSSVYFRGYSIHLSPEIKRAIFNNIVGDQQDKDFSLTVSSGGGKCALCEGTGEVIFTFRKGEGKKCHKCNGTGRRVIKNITIEDLIEGYIRGVSFCSLSTKTERYRGKCSVCGGSGFANSGAVNERGEYIRRLAPPATA